MQAVAEEGMVSKAVNFFRAFFSFEGEQGMEFGPGVQSHLMNGKKARGGKVYRFPEEASAQGAISIKNPRTMEDAKDAANKLLENRVVIMNLSKIEKDLAKEILYFLGGVVFALRGDSKKVGSDIFLFTPENIAVSQLDELQDRMNSKTGLGFDEP
jgi:cell division inhibitor SepF